MAFLYGVYFLSSPTRERLFSKKISTDELRQISVQEYMDMMSGVSLLIIDGKEPEMQGWPRSEDLPYLLTRIHSYYYSGEPIWEFSYIARSITQYHYGTTEEIAAVNLLKAIKEGKFKFHYDSDPEDKDEILAWARAEAAKMEAASNPKKPE